MGYARSSRWQTNIFRSRVPAWYTSIPVGSYSVIVQSLVTLSLSISWSPTSTTLFALCSHSPLEDAAILIQDTRFDKLDPRRIVLKPRPHRVRDFDWLRGSGIGNGEPRIVAGVGRKVMVIDIGGEAFQ